MNPEKWYKKIYLGKYGGLKTSEKDPRFIDYVKKVNDIIEGLPKYEELIPEKKNVMAEVDPLMQLLSPEEKKTGQGYRRKSSKLKVSKTLIPCSRNILDDVSRLEVLIGGKRAGNNSPEITNEATEICQRLFQGKVIGMGLYRNLVNELIDVDYYSD